MDPVSASLEQVARDLGVQPDRGLSAEERVKALAQVIVVEKLVKAVLRRRDHSTPAVSAAPAMAI